MSETGRDPNPKDLTGSSPLSERRTLPYVSPSPGATTPELDPPRGAPPASVPGYEILGELGRGGMGIVYKARQVKAGRVVALKMILSGQRADAIELTRFQTEAEALARVAHPGVVQVYEIGEHDGLPYFSQELCPGGTLAEHLDQYTLVPKSASDSTRSELQAREVKLVRLMRSLALAVDSAHRVGVVHRDLKPSNVLLTADGEPKVSDFGLAKRMDLAQGQTYTGMVLGTPAYMAPEQAAGETRYVGPPVDVYALGVILYELLTGRLPFEAESKLRLLDLVRTQEPAPPRRVQPRVPRDLETICLKCLHKEPAQRYASAAALADDLARFEAGEPIAVRPTTFLERFYMWARRRPAVAALYGLTALVLLLGGFGASAAWLWLRAEGDKRLAEDAQVQGQQAQQREEKANQDLALANEQVERLHYLHRIRLAHREALAKEFFRAESVLKSCPESLRGWEWHYVRMMCQQGDRVFRSHASGTSAVRFSPDASRLLIVAPDGMKLWDRVTNQLLRFWTSTGGSFQTATYSPDGTLIATSGFAQKRRVPEASVQIWRPDTGEELVSLKDRKGLMYCLAFSPDGKLLAGGCLDQSITFWDTRTWQVVRTIPTASELHGISFNADGTLLASAGHREQIQVWDVASGELVQTLPQPGMPQIQVVFGKDDRQLASTDTAGTVWLWDRMTGKAAELSRSRDNRHCPVLFLPNGRELVFSRDEQTIVRDLDAGKERVLEGRSGRVTQLGVSADGRWLASGSADGYVRLYSLDPAAVQEPMVRRLHQESPSIVRVSPEEDTIALVYPGRLAGITRVRLCDAKGQLRAEWKFIAPSTEDPAVSDDLRWLANVVDKTSVQLRDLKTGNLARTLAQDRDPQELVFLGFTPDGKRLAGCGEERTVLWNIETGAVERILDDVPMRAWGLLTTGTTMHFSPDSRLCAYATPEGAAVRELATGRVVFTCERHLGEITTMAFSRDATRFASVSADGVIKVWDLRTGKEEHTLVGHTAMITAASFHPDGKRLASGAGDGSLRLWDLTSGEEALIIEESGVIFSPVQFSPSGRGLIWGTPKGIWMVMIDGR